jgi:4-azaleucine resistance transporter AzlC
MLSARTQFAEGFRAQIPNAPGVFPFGMIAGALTAAVMNSALISVLMTSVVFAGRAQMVAMQLETDGAPLLVILMAALVVNLRHLMYGAALADHFKHLSWKWKVLMALLLTDLGYAVSIKRLSDQADTEDAPTRHWYFVGASVLNWGVWSIGGLLGAFVGGAIPPSLQLDFIPTLSFVLALVINVRDRASLAAAAGAGIFAVAFAGLPWSMGLFVGAMTGLAVGMLVESRRRPA